MTPRLLFFANDLETATLLLNMSVASSKPYICYMIQGCGGVTISNGETAFPAGRNYGAEATITCNRGYDRVGTGFITCLDTGIWDLSTTNCTIKGKMLLKSYAFQIVFFVSDH